METNAEYVAHKGSHCPFCGEDASSEGDAVDFDEGEITQYRGCTDCGEEWRASYQLTGFERIRPYGEARPS